MVALTTGRHPCLTGTHPQRDKLVGEYRAPPIAQPDFSDWWRNRQTVGWATRVGGMGTHDFLLGKRAVVPSNGLARPADSHVEVVAAVAAKWISRSVGDRLR